MLVAAATATGARQATTKGQRISAVVLTERAGRLEAEELHRLIELLDECPQLRLGSLVVRPVRRGRRQRGDSIDQRVRLAERGRELLDQAVEDLAHLAELVLPMQLDAHAELARHQGVERP